MTALLITADDPRWAELLGETPHDFYHLPEYVAISAGRDGGEAAALWIERGRSRLLVPLVLRDVDGTSLDATSPYGYPGPLISIGAPEGFLSDAMADGIARLRRDGVVSLFLRMHPLLNRAPPKGIGSIVQHGHTIAIDLSLSMEELWRETRNDHRNQINRALRMGHRVGWDLEMLQMPTFKRLYRESMIRLNADPYYLFDDDYFDRLRHALGTRMRLCVVEIDEAVAAAALFVETSGIVQYHLSAHDPRFAHERPTKLLLHFVRSWAKEQGHRWFHLGGGVGGQDDSLFEFKAGFSASRMPFRTMRVVIIPEAYARLVSRQDPTSDPAVLDAYFPVYRRTTAVGAHV